MRSNFEILSRSWDAFSAQWLLCLGIAVLHTVISGIIGSVGFGLGSLLLSGALSFGLSRTMVRIYRGQTPTFESYFDGFRHYLSTLVTTLLAAVIITVGAVLLVIPGIIAAVGLSQVYYVLQDNPDLGAEGALRESWRLTWTNGKMWKVFFMGFLMLFLLIGGALVLGVGLFVAIPLVNVLAAGLYEELLLADGQIPNQGDRVEFV